MGRVLGTEERAHFPQTLESGVRLHITCGHILRPGLAGEDQKAHGAVSGGYIGVEAVSHKGGTAFLGAGVAQYHINRLGEGLAQKFGFLSGRETDGGAESASDCRRTSPQAGFFDSLREANFGSLSFF